MKRILLLIISSVSISVSSQSSIFAEAQLKSATVYEQSGELFSTTTFKVPKGSSEIVITNIAENIDDNTIKIGSKNKISVLTYRFTNDNEMYQVELDKRNPQHKMVLDSISIVQKQIRNLEIESGTLNKSLAILDNNSTINAGSNKYASEVSKLIKYNEKKRNGLYFAIDEIAEKLRKLQSRLTVLNKKFNLNNAERENYPKGKIVLQINSEANEDVMMDIKYSVREAYWRPYYDISANGLNSKINLGYKAMVRQNSGLDWKNIKLNLVSGYPNQRQVLPVLGVWQIYYQPEQNVNPAVSIRGQASGVQVQESRSNVSIEEVVVTGPVRNTASQNQLNLSYELEDNYTILSNNKENSIVLNVMDIPAKFMYSAVPRYSNTAFLTAEIDNLDKYNLIKAEANIIFDDTNVGKTVINPETTDSKMVLTLGEDRRISLKRDPIKDKTFSKSISSTNKEQQFAFETTIRNNKSDKITIKIQDQIPISSDRQIIITMVDKGGAEFDEKTGILTWNVTLNANETRKLNFSYKVNSLKNSQLIGL
jgi:uncharacterized protein (TIGR02231 family)